MSYSGSAGGGIGGVSPASTPQVAAVPGTKILLCKSGVKNKKPDPAGAEYGEVFVNYHSGSPMLCFKDNAGEIVEIKPTRNIDGGGGETPPSTGNEIGDTLWDGTHFRVWDGSTWVAIGPNDLAYVQKVDGGTITNSAGSDVDIPVVNNIQAGLMLPADKNKLDTYPADSADLKVDLGYTAAADRGTVTNSNGDDAEIPLATGTNAGLMAPGDKNKIDGYPATPGDLAATLDLQAVTDNGNTTTNLIEAGGGVKVTGGNLEIESFPAVDANGNATSAFIDTTQPADIAFDYRGFRVDLDLDSKRSRNVNHFISGNFDNAGNITGEIAGFKATANGSAQGVAARAFVGGYNASANNNVFNFFAENNAPNFFKGDTYIGGTTAVPNISLNNNGTSEFKSYARINRASATNDSQELFSVSSGNNNGTSNRGYLMNVGGFYVNTSDSTGGANAKAFIKHDDGAAQFGSGNIKLNADGSAYMKGGLNISPNSTAVPSASGQRGGFYAATTAGGVEICVAGQSALNMNRLTTDGEIQTFYRGSAKIGSIEVDSENLTINGKGQSDHFVLHSNGNSEFSSGNITLNASGSAEFAGSVAIGGSVGNQTVNGVYLNDGGYVASTGSAGNNVWLGYLNGTATPTSTINADGSAKYKGFIHSGNRDTTSSSAAGANINSTGSIYWQGLATAADTATVFMYTRGRANGGGPGEGDMIKFFANGNATFAGNIDAGNVFFNLEPDNEANYEVTTEQYTETETYTVEVPVLKPQTGAADLADEDAEQEREMQTITKEREVTKEREIRTYVGPVLDVKERLLKTEAALMGLKEAVTTANTCDDLKAAIVSALAVL